MALGISNVRVLASSEGPDRESLFPGRFDALGAPTPWRILPSMQPSPGAYNEAVVAGLDFLLAEMARRDMTAVLMLGNMWPWSGGFAQYVSWATGVPIPFPLAASDVERFLKFAKAFFNTADAVRHWLRHVRYVLTRVNSLTGVPYRDDPTIMAWELANEPRPMKRVAAYRAWVDSVTALLKELDLARDGKSSMVKDLIKARDESAWLDLVVHKGSVYKGTEGQSTKGECTKGECTSIHTLDPM